MFVKVNFLLFLKVGALAQLVEQWTENPCVPGSIPGGTTFLTLIEGFLIITKNSKPLVALILMVKKLHYPSEPLPQSATSC